MLGLQSLASQNCQKTQATHRTKTPEPCPLSEDQEMGRDNEGPLRTHPSPASPCLLKLEPSKPKKDNHRRLKIILIVPRVSESNEYTKVSDYFLLFVLYAWASYNNMYSLFCEASLDVNFLVYKIVSSGDRAHMSRPT